MKRLTFEQKLKKFQKEFKRISVRTKKKFEREKLKKKKIT